MKRTLLLLATFILLTGTAAIGIRFFKPGIFKHSNENTPTASAVENNSVSEAQILRSGENTFNTATSSASQTTRENVSDSDVSQLSSSVSDSTQPSESDLIAASSAPNAVSGAAVTSSNSNPTVRAPENPKRRKFLKVSELPDDSPSAANLADPISDLDISSEVSAKSDALASSDLSIPTIGENQMDGIERESSLSVPEQNSSVGTVVVNSTPRTVENGLIIPIYEVDVPAEEAGVMRKLYVQDFAQIRKDELLVQIDDRQAVMAVNVAEAKKESAEIQMKNDVNVRYAVAAHAVANAEIKKADEANHKVPNTVPDVEYNRLVLSRTQANLQIEQAQQELKVAAQNYNVSMAELDAAKLDQTRFEIHSPHDGVVMEIFRKEGEWLKPGDPILHLVQMNPIRYSFRIESKTPPESIFGQTVKLFIPTIGREVQGTITFVKPSHDIGDMYQVWVDIENTWQPFKNHSETAIQKGYWILQPGMRAEVKSIGK